MVRAIKTAQVDFLYSVFAFNKNYEQHFDNDSDSEVPQEEDFLNQVEQPKKYTVFTFDWLFKNVIEFCQDDADQRIRQIAQLFRFESSENVLMSMLKNRQDMVAANYGNNYRYCVQLKEYDAEKEEEVFTCELLLFAFKNQNEIFLKYAFRDAADGPALFTSSIFHENERVIDAVL